jgi:hypothetical protein
MLHNQMIASAVEQYVHSYMPACEYPQVGEYWAVKIAYAALEEAYGCAHQAMEVPDAEAYVDTEKRAYASVWGETYDLHTEKCRDVYLIVPCEDNPRVNRMIRKCELPPRSRVTCNNCGCTIEGDSCPTGCPYADFAISYS